MEMSSTFSPADAARQQGDPLHRSSSFPKAIVQLPVDTHQHIPPEIPLHHMLEAMQKSIALIQERVCAEPSVRTGEHRIVAEHSFRFNRSTRSTRSTGHRVPNTIVTTAPVDRQHHKPSKSGASESDSEMFPMSPLMNRPRGDFKRDATVARPHQQSHAETVAINIQPPVTSPGAPRVVRRDTHLRLNLQTILGKDVLRAVDDSHPVIVAVDWCYLVVSTMFALVVMYSLHPTTNTATWCTVRELIALDVVLNVVTAFWILSRFFVCARATEWQMTTDLTEVRRRYLRGWFFFDVLYAVPIEWIGCSHALPLRTFQYIQARQLLRFARFPSLMVSANPLAGMRRVNALTIAVAVMMVVVNCAALIAHSLDFIAMDPRISLDTYIRSVHWAVTTIATVGYGDIIPASDNSRVFTIVVEILGVVMVSCATALFTNFLTKRNILSAHEEEKKRRLNAFMEYYDIPHNIQREIIELFPLVVHHEREREFRELIDALPRSICELTRTFLRVKTIRVMPLLATMPLTVLEFLANRLKEMLAMSGDYIIEQGAVGSEMFFIVRGVVTVQREDETTGEVTQIASLKDGDFLGEMALMGNGIRGASCVAATNCELLILVKEDFERALSQWPLLKNAVTSVLEKRGLRPSVSAECRSPTLQEQLHPPLALIVTDPEAISDWATHDDNMSRFEDSQSAASVLRNPLIA